MKSYVFRGNQVQAKFFFVLGGAILVAAFFSSIFIEYGLFAGPGIGLLGIALLLNGWTIWRIRLVVSEDRLSFRWTGHNGKTVA